MNPPSDSDALALARHAAASWIQEALKQNFTLARATALASERTWGGKTYSASTLEGWYYLLRNQGFAALHRQPRKDKGLRKALSPDACQALLEWRQKYPHMLIHLMQVDGFRRYCKCQDRHSRKACVNSVKSFRVTRTAGSIFRRAVGLKDFAVRSATVPAVGGS
jgi:hypothetical protein